ncbi:MAG: hypothetical protein E6J14_15745 [Chloroflexi bacterium]|nr:MAG: hypothetical protein E6J14_15745 [Chloroflexota bacterium]
MGQLTNELVESVKHVWELSEFAHLLRDKLSGRSFKHGDDLTIIIEDVRIPVPAFMKDAPITYAEHAKHRNSEHMRGGKQPLALIAQPHRIAKATPTDLVAFGFCIATEVGHVCVFVVCFLFLCLILIF